MPFRGFESSPTGTLVNVLTSETWRTSLAVATLVHVIVTACILSVYTILLVAVSWKLTFIVAIALAINGLLVRYATRGLSDLGIEFSRLNARLQSQLIACIEGMKTVRLFGQERREQRNFHDTSMSIGQLIFKMYRIGDTVT